MTTDEYLYFTEESQRKRELHRSRVAEPPAPLFSHQQIVLRIARFLCDHVEPRRLGQVAIAPVDVVLDAGQALILQPDVLFIAAARTAIISNQVWGAPDLVVEVFSMGTLERDSTEKLGWYRQYGVRECWLADPFSREVRSFDFSAGQDEERLVRKDDPIVSRVLPDLALTPNDIFVNWTL